MISSSFGNHSAHHYLNHRSRNFVTTSVFRGIYKPLGWHDGHPKGVRIGNDARSASSGSREALPSNLSVGYRGTRDGFCRNTLFDGVKEPQPLQAAGETRRNSLFEVKMTIQSLLNAVGRWCDEAGKGNQHRREVVQRQRQVLQQARQVVTKPPAGHATRAGGRYMAPGRSRNDVGRCHKRPRQVARKRREVEQRGPSVAQYTRKFAWLTAIFTRTPCQAAQPWPL